MKKYQGGGESSAQCSVIFRCMKIFHNRGLGTHFVSAMLQRAIFLSMLSPAIPELIEWVFAFEILLMWDSILLVISTNAIDRLQSSSL